MFDAGSASECGRAHATTLLPLETDGKRTERKERLAAMPLPASRHVNLAAAAAAAAACCA